MMLEYALWTREDEKYPVNKVTVEGVDYNQARLREIIRAKIREWPPEKVHRLHEIARFFGEKYRERRPLKEYVPKTKAELKRRPMGAYEDYIDDIIIDAGFTPEVFKDAINLIIREKPPKPPPKPPEVPKPEPWWPLKAVLLEWVTSRLRDMMLDPGMGVEILHKTFDPKKSFDENKKAVEAELKARKIKVKEITPAEYSQWKSFYEEYRRKLEAKSKELFKEAEELKAKRRVREAEELIEKAAEVYVDDVPYKLKKLICPYDGAELIKAPAIPYLITRTWYECRDCQIRFIEPFLGMCPTCHSPRWDSVTGREIKLEPVPPGYFFYICPIDTRVFEFVKGKILEVRPDEAIRRIRKIPRIVAPPPVPIPAVPKVMPAEAHPRFDEFLADERYNLNMTRERFEALPNAAKEPIRRMFWFWLTEKA